MTADLNKLSAFLTACSMVEEDDAIYMMEPTATGGLLEKVFMKAADSDAVDVEIGPEEVAFLKERHLYEVNGISSRMYYRKAKEIVEQMLSVG